MTLFNYLFDNMTEVLFYSAYLTTTCLITGMFIKNTFFNESIDSNSPIIETPTTDSGVSTIKALSSSTAQPSPTLHHMTSDQLIELETILDQKVDQGIQTKNVYRNELSHYYGHYSVFAEIKINENISTILMSTNLDYDLVNEIKDYTQSEIMNDFRNVKSHVGIAAAVTSYARIEMMRLKSLLNSLGIKIYYTDTDSFFVDGILPNNLVGEDLGQLKDELKGEFIEKAYFLGIKKYGYIDKNGKVHSVFSGVPRDSLSWNEIEQISKGNTIIKNVPIRFYKNLSNLNISIKNSMMTTIEFNTRKKEINNKYQPIKMNGLTRWKCTVYTHTLFTNTEAGMQTIDLNSNVGVQAGLDNLHFLPNSTLMEFITNNPDLFHNIF